MTPAILWKEYREHRVVWTALAFLGAAMVLSRSILLRAGLPEVHPEAREILISLTAILVGVYALICGAMMLAGEYENRTMSYLDALPGLRRQLWRGKFLAGVLLVFGQIVFLISLCAALSLFQKWTEVAWTFAAMLLAGLFGFSWGIWFSSFGRSVMSAILLSLAGCVALGLMPSIPAVLFVGLISVISGAEPTVIGVPITICLYAMVAPAALVVSALVFTRIDRNRFRAAPASSRGEGGTLHPTWTVLFWLAWRQARGFALGMAAFALLLGFIILFQGELLWPVATLVVGVLCGATAFADEQLGPFRFLGDQRLPLGRLWVVKVGVRLGVAVVAALLVLAPGFISALASIPESRWDNPQGEYHVIAHVFHSDLLVNLCPPGLFLGLWLVYGFCSGCLFGLLFRHGLAAGVFALFTGALSAALWIPSLLAGGLHGWQVFCPPVLIMVASRLLMRPWASGRIASWATAARLTPFVMLAGSGIACGLWYRVLEIPNAPQRMDLDAFRASLPTPEQDEGGRLFHSACLRFENLRRTLESQLTPLAGAPGAMAPGEPNAAPPGGVGVVGGMPVAAPLPGADDRQRVGPPPMETERAYKTLEHGWPDDDHGLAVWLDKLYAGEWAPMLKKAADLPTSPFDDARDMTLTTLLPATQPAREVAVVLVARALQRQAAGDDEAYVENLRVGLSLSRSLRDHTPTTDAILGQVVEHVLLTGLDRWLEKLHGRPDLIRQAIANLSRHSVGTAEDDKDQELVDDLIMKNSVENPLPVLQLYLTEDGLQIKAGANRVRDEAEWVAAAWSVPWEQARRDRLLRMLFEGERMKSLGDWLQIHRKDLGPLSQLGPYHQPFPTKPAQKCARPAMLLKLALRWYQADNGRAAETLDELVPKYLPSLPLDPYDGEPFRYRLSRGEEIEWPSDPSVAPMARAALKIPPGQGVLWSVGVDKVDHGSHRQSSPLEKESAPGEDLIFLVPLPPKGK